MKVVCKPFELKLKHPFSIAGFTRNSTPIILVDLEYDGYVGKGEASMVPYMGESFETAASFISKIDLRPFKFPFNYEEILTYLDSMARGSPAIKAAIDIALHDLQGKIEGKPCYNYFHSVPKKMPVTSFTIGIDIPEVIQKKVEEARECKIIKVKLGRDNDKELINAIRSMTEKPLYVDANQGWKDKNEALEMVFWLKEQGVELIEQPMHKEDLEGNAWITARSPIPIIGDEAVQRFSDVEKAKGVYHGINVKLMKSAGMHEGYKMIQKAREMGLKVLIGCMSETSIATLAGAALAPLCDWVDLDGPFLTSNNPFKDPLFQDGKYILSESPGLGIELK